MGYDCHNVEHFYYYGTLLYAFRLGELNTDDLDVCSHASTTSTRDKLDSLRKLIVFDLDHFDVCPHTSSTTSRDVNSIRDHELCAATQARDNKKQLDSLAFELCPSAITPSVITPSSPSSATTSSYIFDSLP